jgi:hypothetical protein
MVGTLEVHEIPEALVTFSCRPVAPEVPNAMNWLV